MDRDRINCKGLKQMGEISGRFNIEWEYTEEMTLPLTKNESFVWGMPFVPIY